MKRVKLELHFIYGIQPGKTIPATFNPGRGYTYIG
jgi:hypothetical protein